MRAKLVGLTKGAGDDADDIAAGLSLTELEQLKKIAEDLEAVAEDGGSLFLAELGIPAEADLFGQVSERAVAYARERAAELVTGLDESTRDDLRALIANGLESGASLDGIIESIQDSYAFSEDRADLIARTEVATANQNGVLEGMRSARDAGVKLQKTWLPDADACDDCQENGDAGPIDLDDDFPSGDDAPPAHPNCRCDMASEVDESDLEDLNLGADEVDDEE